MTSIDTPRGWVRRLVAVIVTMTATMATLVGATAPAGAAACSSASGVSVVVDFTGAADGVQSVCVPGGADRPAAEVIGAAGFTLTGVTREPGFVCRVNGVPASDPCVNTPPTTAYWGLFWSDGKDGAWHYSDFGVSGLQVPDGGYIGLAWQSGTRRTPGLAATAHAAPAPSPPSPTSAPSTPAPSTTPSTGSTPAPTTKPTTKPTTGSTGKPRPTTAPTRPPTSPGSPSSSDSPSASPTTSTPASPDESSSSAPGQPTTSATPSPSESTSGPAAVDTSDPTGPTSGPATAAPSSTDPDPSASRTEDSSGRVPTWLTVVILALLLVAIGTSTYAARRRTHH